MEVMGVTVVCGAVVWETDVSVIFSISLLLPKAVYIKFDIILISRK